MALYELPDHVVKNLNAIVDNAPIKGAEALAIVEIKQCLAKPVAQPPAAPVAGK